MISVIVPTYNAETFLTRTLDTVLAQTFSDWELLIVNDGSTDGTQAVAEAYAARDARIHALSKPNGGCAAARNYGLERADPNAEYILFLDHDDLWEAHALQTLLDTVHVLPDCVGAVGGARVIQDDQAKEESTLQALRENTGKTTGQQITLTFADMLILNHIWTMGQVLMRRDVLEKAGSLDIQSAPVDDWDVYLRLTQHGPFAATDTPVIHWRSHAANTSKNVEKMRQAEEYVRQKVLASPHLSPEQRQMAASSFKNAQRNLAAMQWQWARECLSRREMGQALRQVRRAVLNYTHFCMRQAQSSLYKSSRGSQGTT